MRSLLGASWFAVRRTPVLVPCLAAAVLVAVTWPWQDDGHAVDVLHGLAVLLACACAGTADDPSGEVAASSPYPPRVRVLTRLAAGLALVLPLAVAGSVVAELRYPPTPLLAQLAEGLGYGVAAVAIAAALRTWGQQLSPSYLAAVGLIGLALVTFLLPRGWTMVGPQPWGPPLEAALLRWAALVVVAVAVLVACLRDRAGDAG